MREIKFRGYSKTSEKWVYGYYRCVYAPSEGERGRYHFIDNIFGISYEVYEYSVGQYIGKKLNGVEIYEGDVISLESDGRGYYFIGEVMFDPDEIDHKLAVGDDIYGEGGWEYLLWSDIQDVKILGNGYENPELEKQYGKNYVELDR